MKPTNAHQLRVVQLQKKVRNLTDAQKKWAIRNCFDIDCIKHKNGNCYCLSCGHEFHTDEDDTLLQHVLTSAPETVCPHCGAKLHITTSRKFHFSDKSCMLIISAVEEFMLVRRFEVRRHVTLKHGNSYVEHAICEIIQNWISPTGREHICARSMSVCSWNSDFSWTSDLSLKKTCVRGYDYQLWKYRISGAVYPHKSVTGVIRRNGFDGSFHGADPADFIINLLTSPELEFILKTKQFAFCPLFTYGGHGAAIVKSWKHVIKIYNRNHVKIHDVDELTDMCSMLNRLGGDTHNPKNVLFKTKKQLHKAHNEVCRRLNRREQARREREEFHRRQEQIKKLIQEKDKDEAAYERTHAPFIPIQFGNGIFHAHVLQNIDEFWDEGNAMHHCVFSNAYFRRKDSVVMSVTDEKSGERIETCEVSLTNFNILQCYGPHDKFTKYHNEIIAFIKANIYLLQKAKQQTILCQTN